VTIRQTGKVAVAEVVNQKTKRVFELAAGDCEIEVKEKDSGLRLKTTEFTLTRGGRETFRARVLLGPVTHGTLVLENRHPTARLQVGVLNVADGFNFMTDLINKKGGFDLGGIMDLANVQKFADKIPEIRKTTLAPGESRKLVLQEGKYSVIVESVTP